MAPQATTERARLPVMRPIPLLLLAVACDDTQFPAPAGGAETGITDDYAGMQSLFDGQCLACHAAAVKLGGLDLETDPCSALVGVPSANTDYGGALRVAAGDHEASVLWNKVNGTDVYGQRMPQGGQLDDASISAVEAWIDAGASCTADSGGDTDTGGGDTDTGVDTAAAGLYSYDRVQAIFDANCTRCHQETDSENPDASATMWLTADVSYESIVGHASVKSSLLRVSTDGVPENSFLWHKVYHDIATDGSEGSTMPKGTDMLTPDDLGILYGWMAAGAPQ